jgi:arsenical pump membrane protein
VVLTPAVAAAARTAQAGKPLPYLFICAFIANAASFVLPISNPANLVIYGAQMPPLGQWLPRLALPSALSIGITYAVLRIAQRKALLQPIESDVELPALSPSGKTAAAGIVVTAVVLLTASALDRPLGLPGAIAGLATAAVVLLRQRKGPLGIARGISWGVLPLVAGLFVLVEALDKTGLIALIAGGLRRLSERSPGAAAWAAGLVTGFGCNLTNNLPAGLIAGDAVHAAGVPEHVATAVLIGIDLGPNLSVTGSLATILWLSALRREGHQVGAMTFLKLGVLVMPVSLVAALVASFLTR